MNSGRIKGREKWQKGKGRNKESTLSEKVVRNDA